MPGRERRIATDTGQNVIKAGSQSCSTDTLDQRHTCGNSSVSSMSTFPPPRPKQAGKAPEQHPEEVARYNSNMREFFAHAAAARREQAEALGVKEYEWLASGNSCEIALRNNGKTFAYQQPPGDGHPCEGVCTSDDWCRCVALPLVRFDAPR